MKKGIALIALVIILAVLVVTNPNLIGHDDALEGAQVVAKVNGEEITKAEWEAYRDYMISYYQQYYQQYYGFTFTPSAEDVAAYGESALEAMIQGKVVEAKAKELGLDPLSADAQAEAESYAQSQLDFYKMLLRYQNHADIETVEEEAARLEEATLSEATPAEAVAAVTDAELDAMLTEELAAMGITYDAFVEDRVNSVVSDGLYAEATKDVTITDEQVKAQYETLSEAQKTAYDEDPTGYAGDVNSGKTIYYIPAGYRGIKHVLVSLNEEDQTAIDELNTALTTAKNAAASAQKQLDELKAADTAAYDADAKAAYDEELAALEATVTEQNAAAEKAQADLDAKTEEAFAAVLPTAQEVLDKAQAGEDFDALIETYGKDPGMNAEPAKTQGYLVCDGLKTFVTEFQDAAMALEKVGDISGLVKTSYGYHILKYVADIESGMQEFTQDMADEISTDMLKSAKDAAYDAAVSQWTAAAKVETFPKIMK